MLSRNLQQGRKPLNDERLLNIVDLLTDRMLTQASARETVFCPVGAMFRERELTSVVGYNLAKITA
jgi:hypothetical protein